MIKGLYSGGRYITVNNGQPGVPTVYNNTASINSSGAQGFAGQLRFNSSMGGLEVFDGSMWQRMDSTVAQINLSPEAEHLLDWVKQKILEEVELQSRMQSHPGLKDAYERFKIMDALTLKETNNHGEVQSSP